MKKIFKNKKTPKLKYNYYKKYRDIKAIIEKRYSILILLILFVVVVLFINIFYLQIIQEKKYKKELAILNKTIVDGATAPRGRIYDRHKRLIVDNKPNKEIIYQKTSGIKVSDEIELAHKLAALIKVDYSKLKDYDLRNFWVRSNPKEAKAKITKNEMQQLEYRKTTVEEIEKLKRQRVTKEELKTVDKEAAYIYYLMNKGYSYQDKVIKKDNVTDEEYVTVASNLKTLKGFDTRLGWERTYPYGNVFKVILGNVSSTENGIPADMKERYLQKGYNLNDRVGTSYLEYQYDDYLKGEKNKYEVLDNKEKVLIKEGHRGNDLVLTIDIELQKGLEEILTREVISTKYEANTRFYNRSFAVIADPKTGEILAMAGKQVKQEEDGSYSVVDFTPGIMTSPVAVGSVIKGASHTVGYTTGNLRIGETRYDKCIKLAGAPQKCSWKDLGSINDLTALKLSSNVYQFYTAMRVAGVNYYYGMPFSPSADAFKTYRDTFASFGLGIKTGIDLPVESEGVKGQSKVGGLLLDFSIGQYDTYTPIQLSQYISTLANNGTRMKPHLLKAVYSYKDKLNKKIYENKPEEASKVKTKQEYLDRIRQGFIQVLQHGGTGSGYMNLGYRPAGKTGTSESFVDSDGDGKIDTPTVTTTFAAYAPYDNPKVSFAILSPDIYYPGSGGEYQSTVNKRLANEISNLYFSIYY